jgi:hypothetical protein
VVRCLKTSLFAAEEYFFWEKTLSLRSVLCGLLAKFPSLRARFANLSGRRSCYETDLRATTSHHSPALVIASLINSFSASLKKGIVMGAMIPVIFFAIVFAHDLMNWARKKEILHRKRGKSCPRPLEICLKDCPWSVKISLLFTFYKVLKRRTKYPLREPPERVKCEMTASPIGEGCYPWKETSNWGIWHRGICREGYVRQRG